MGKRGPLPKKKHLKDLSRQPLTKERAQEVERILTTDPPDPPVHLTEAERKIWDDTISLLKPAGVLQRIDAAVLAAYCVSFVRWQTAEVEIKKMLAAHDAQYQGLVSEGANGQIVVNPMVNVSRRERADMIGFAAQMGMTPSARMRISVQPSKDEENPFAMLKQKKKNGDMGAKSSQLRGVRKPQKK